MKAASQGEHDVFGDDLNGGGQIHMEWLEIALRVAWWLAEQRMEALAGHTKTTMKFKKLKIEPKGSVILDIDQVVFDCFDIFGFAVGS